MRRHERHQGRNNDKRDADLTAARALRMPQI